MAGHMLSLYFQERGHQVIALAQRNLPWGRSVLVDALDRDALRKAVAAHPADAIVNCVGVLNRSVDALPSAGIYLNACLPHLLAEWTVDKPTRVVHLSTDCVFSGHDGDGGYMEDAFRSADTLYGRSKALGELCDGKNLTLRTSIVGPDVNPGGVGLFNWFMKQPGPVQGFTRAVWTGVTTLVLARAVEAALGQNLAGLYHLVNGERIDKCELLQLFNRLRAAPVEITPVPGEAVDKSLVNTRRDFAFRPPSYAEMVMELGGWIAAHASWYPHYQIAAAAEKGRHD